jgi:hypothetical protein
MQEPCQTNERVPFDLVGYVDRGRNSPCFICRIVTGTHDREQHILHRDERHIVLLPAVHVLRGSLMAEVAGVLDLGRDEQAALARSLSEALASGFAP